MQTGKAELMAQQVVLAFLGFYKGAIDGIWSGESIRAKQAFEREDAYVPGVPSNGLPFAPKGKLPKGLYWDGKRLLNHRSLTPEKMAEIIKSRTRVAKPAAPVVPPKQEQPVNPKATPTEDQSDDDAE